MNRCLSRVGRKTPINRTHSKRFALAASQRATRQHLDCVRLQRRFPKAGCDSMTRRFMESPLSLFRMHWDHELPGGCSAGVLACECTGRPARCSCGRRDAFVAYATKSLHWGWVGSWKASLAFGRAIVDAFQDRDRALQFMNRILEFFFSLPGSRRFYDAAVWQSSNQNAF